MNCLFQSLNEWRMISHDRLMFVKPFTSIKEETLFVINASGSISGIFNFEGDSKHAKVLIERRLRTNGAIDDEAKIVVHETIETTGSYQALFTAIPIVEWVRMMSWVEVQNNHCMVVTLMDCLRNELKKPGEAIIYKGEKELVFLAWLPSRFIQFTIQTFSSAREDVLNAMPALADRIESELADIGAEKETKLLIRWASFDAQDSQNQPDDEFIQIVTNRAQTTIQPLKHHRLKNTHTDEQVWSAIPEFLSNFKLSNALNSGQEKIQLAATNYTSKMAFFAIFVALFAMVQAVLYTVQIWQLSEKIDDKRKEIQLIESSIESLASSKSIETEYQEIQKFLMNAMQVQESFDVVTLLQTLKDASSTGTRVLRVYGEVNNNGNNGKKGDKSNGNQSQLFINVGTELDGNRAPIIRFMDTLKNVNYEVIPVDSQVTDGSTTLGNVSTFQLRRPNNKLQP
jgi:hypothetical protein